MIRTKKSTDAPKRREPIEPRYVVTMVWGVGDNARERDELLICPDCEGAFTGRWSPAGQPIYSGGWRHVLLQNGQAGDHGDPYKDAYGPCHCQVGQILAKGNNRLPLVPRNYPPNERVTAFRVLPAEDYAEWQDPRAIRPVGAEELDRWRDRHATGRAEEMLTDWEGAVGDEERLDW